MSSGPVEFESAQDAVVEVERLRAGLHDLIEDWARRWWHSESFDSRDAYLALRHLLGEGFDVGRFRGSVPPAPEPTLTGDTITAASEESTSVRRFDGEPLEGEALFLRIVARSEETFLVASREGDEHTAGAMVIICTLADDDILVHYAVSDGGEGWKVTLCPEVAWETALKFADQGFEWDVAADTRLRARTYRDTPAEFLP